MNKLTRNDPGQPVLDLQGLERLWQNTMNYVDEKSSIDQLRRTQFVTFTTVPSPDETMQIGYGEASFNRAPIESDVGTKDIGWGWTQDALHLIEFEWIVTSVTFDRNNVPHALLTLRYFKIFTMEEGLPDGGTIGQLLAKKSDENGDADWIDVPLRLIRSSGIYNKFASTTTLYTITALFSSFNRTPTQADVGTDLGLTVLIHRDMNTQAVYGIYLCTSKIYSVNEETSRATITVENRVYFSNGHDITANGGLSSGTDGLGVAVGDGVELVDGKVSLSNPTHGIMTQEEFDALTDEEKAKGTYFVEGSEDEEKAKGTYFVEGSEDGGGSDTSDSNGDIYSTEETRIGTWIDGKPLYRRLINGTFPTKNGQTSFANVSSYTADTFAQIRGMVKKTTYNYQIPYNLPGVDGYISTYVIGGSLYIYCELNTALGNALFGGTCVMILEYTKTTDKPEVAR